VSTFLTFLSLAQGLCLRLIAPVIAIGSYEHIFAITEVFAMSHTKQTSKRKRRRKAIPVLGAAGLSLSLAGGASGGPAVDMRTPKGGVNHEITLFEEEISDVSLATFYVFDKENIGTLRPGVQLARGGCRGGGCGCRGCGGCGGFRGCGGCRGCVGFRGCGGCVGFVACGGCGGCSPWWGGCRLC
jgi:hypothetical protein